MMEVSVFGVLVYVICDLILIIYEEVWTNNKNNSNGGKLRKLHLDY